MNTVWGIHGYTRRTCAGGASSECVSTESAVDPRPAPYLDGGNDTVFNLMVPFASINRLRCRVFADTEMAEMPASAWFEPPRRRRSVGLMRCRGFGGRRSG